MPNYQPQYNVVRQYTNLIRRECISREFLMHAGIPVTINDEGIPTEDGINPILGTSQSNKFMRVLKMGVYLLHKDADCAYPYTYKDNVYYRNNKKDIKEKYNPLSIRSEKVAEQNISVYRLPRITKNSQFKNFPSWMNKNTQFPKQISKINSTRTSKNNSTRTSKNNSTRTSKNNSK